MEQSSVVLPLSPATSETLRSRKVLLVKKLTTFKKKRDRENA